MRKALSRFYWLLGFAGNVHWAISTGAGLVVAALSTAYAFMRAMPTPLLVVLFIGVFLLIVGGVNHAANRLVTKQNRLTPEEQQREQDRLDAYRTQMERWLHDKDAPLRQDETFRASAQDRTIEILPRLSPDGKRSVLHFLYKHQLINIGTAIISLWHADLSRANLQGLGLTDALLNHANLRDADLSDATLCTFQASFADIRQAIRRRDADWSEVNLWNVQPSQPKDISHLVHADLSGAVLRGTHLAGCILKFADFADADLDEADLRAADLRGALNLTQEQIESAYGSRSQRGGMPDTLLPDGLEAPLKWKLPLTEQKAARRAREAHDQLIS